MSLNRTWYAYNTINAAVCQIFLFGCLAIHPNAIWHPYSHFPISPKHGAPTQCSLVF